MASKVACVSVDLDPVSCYEQIHGLVPAVTTPDAVYATALGRLSVWARALGVPITWFLVGRALDDAGACSQLSALHAQGDELANHTETHPYELTRLPASVTREELAQTNARLKALTGEGSFGFRAPGYRVTDALLRLLRETDALYDSSVFPCPWYYAAKATVLVGQRLIGRKSRSLLDHPRVLLSPRLPYHVGEHYWRSGKGLVELPVTVTPRARLPFIGTTLVLAGRRGATLLAGECCREPFVNLELHGIDALDERDGLAHLAPVQPDLRVPWQRKLERIGAAVERLRRAGFGFTTLREAARLQ